MRRLLTIGVSVIVLGWFLVCSDAPAMTHAASYQVTTYLYHPVGTDSTQGLLTCGWHDGCDGHFSDVSDIGLDWTNSTASTQTWVRLKAYASPAASTWVGRVSTYKPSTGCRRMQSDVRRIDQYLVGRVVQNHTSSGGQSYYMNLFASSAGVWNIGSYGYYIPHSQDNCPSSYDHVMQWYESGDVDVSWYRNSAPPGAMPHESECFHCNTPWWYLNTYEYKFKYDS